MKFVFEMGLTFAELVPLFVVSASAVYQIIKTATAMRT
jgi:predicted DNA-binding protein YlxM (UPF0122 family)